MKAWTAYFYNASPKPEPLKATNTDAGENSVQVLRENSEKIQHFSAPLLKRLSPYFLLIFICVCLFLPGISSLPIMDRDESHFAQATRQMMESGNYFSTQFLNITRHQKSPAINWLQAATVELFSTAKSNKIWPYRLPSFLGALASVLLLFYFTKDIFDERTAFLSSALLASSVLLILEAHIAVIDACLLATIIAMQGILWKKYVDYKGSPLKHVVPRLDRGIQRVFLDPAIQSRDDGSVIFWLALSAGFFLKGVAPLIAFLTVAALCIADRNIRWLKSLNPISGITLFIFTTLLWVIPASIANHGNYLLQLFQHDLLPKLMHGVELHGEPPGYYLLIFSLIFFPGSLFVFFAIRWAWQNRRQKKERFLIAWIIPCWIFYALMPTKLTQYMLPLFPAIAVLTARGLLNFRPPIPRFFRFFQYFQLFIWLTLGIGMVALPFLLAHTIHNSLPKIALVNALFFLAFIFMALIFFFRQHYSACLFSSIFGIISYCTILSIWILPSFSNFWLSQRIVQSLQVHAPNLISRKNPLITIDYDEPSLAFYLGTQNIRLGSHLNEINTFLISKDQLEEIQKDRKFTVKIIAKASAYNYSLGIWQHYYVVHTAKNPHALAACPHKDDVRLGNVT